MNPTDVGFSELALLRQRGTLFRNFSFCVRAEVGAQACRVTALMGRPLRYSKSVRGGECPTGAERRRRGAVDFANALPRCHVRAQFRPFCRTFSTAGWCVHKGARRSPVYFTNKGLMYRGRHGMQRYNISGINSYEYNHAMESHVFSSKPVDPNLATVRIVFREFLGNLNGLPL